MYVTLRPVLGVVGLVCGIVFPSSVFAVAPVSETILTPECRGCVSDKAAETHSRGARVLRSGPLIIDLGGSITSADSAYVAGLLRSIMPLPLPQQVPMLEQVITCFARLPSRNTVMPLQPRR